MERKHQQRLRQEFKAELQNRKIKVLAIPDNYRYMDPELIELLKDAVKPFLPSNQTPLLNASAAQQASSEKYND
ncbi:hypothetical protein [Adhaeribacter rhizoryzae]|uniref:hypothetical protein n=1 Tax=Adhaeribacter rhizoryzae TaxID=2607907 RepID=UPI001CC21A44|nr:hypothetical protein [Adhaeribacter rhizoryzae]